MRAGLGDAREEGAGGARENCLGINVALHACKKPPECSQFFQAHPSSSSFSQSSCAGLADMTPVGLSRSGGGKLEH